MTDEQAKALRAKFARLRELVKGITTGENNGVGALAEYGLCLSDIEAAVLPPPSEPLWPEGMGEWERRVNEYSIYLWHNNERRITIHTSSNDDPTPAQADWFLDWLQAGPKLWEAMVAWHARWGGTEPIADWHHNLYSAITALREEAGR